MSEFAADFEPWYVANYSRLVATLYLVTGDKPAATEAVDEACARAFERWSRVRNMESPDGWAWVVARNALNATRRADRRRADAHQRSLDGPAPPNMEVEVWDAVQRLPRREREVVALRYLGGFLEREIAETLGIAPGTVARALHDARQSLAESLGTEPYAEDRRA